MFSRNSRGERRASPTVYKLLLTSHIMVSVGWLGATFAKIVLGMVAVTGGVLETSIGLYRAMEVLNVAFPPLAVGTLITGGLLSLGTRWGLLDHYWVVTKLVLTVGVIVTGIRMTDAFVDRAMAGAPTSLMILTTLHVLMLASASIISVYKPWGTTWFAARTNPLTLPTRTSLSSWLRQVKRSSAH